MLNRNRGASGGGCDCGCSCSCGGRGDCGGCGGDGGLIEDPSSAGERIGRASEGDVVEWGILLFIACWGGCNGSCGRNANINIGYIGPISVCLSLILFYFFFIFIIFIIFIFIFFIIIF